MALGYWFFLRWNRGGALRFSRFGLRFAWLAAPLFACASGATPIQEAALLSEKGRDQEAIRVLEAHLAKRPDAVAERRLLLRLQAVVGHLGKAQEQAEELAKRLGPGSPIPWIELGHALELAHRYDDALGLYDKAAEVAPRDPSGPREGGLRAARWGEAELALPRLEEALRRDSRAADVWHALGLVRVRLGDLPGAQVAYDSGLVADPRALENRIGLATLALRRHDAAAALRQYDLVLEARPGFADGYLGRSWALIALGRLDEAIAAIDEARRRVASPRAVELQTRLLESSKPGGAFAGKGPKPPEIP
jgi:tetratricopeptide (TPR) repeat protein